MKHVRFIRMIMIAAAALLFAFQVLSPAAVFADGEDGQAESGAVCADTEQTGEQPPAADPGTGSTEPAQPGVDPGTEPADPSPGTGEEPVLPQEPSDPSVPDPVEPSDPSVPDPAEPSDPAEPADPSDPALPSDPSVPADPSEETPEVGETIGDTEDPEDSEKIEETGEDPEEEPSDKTETGPEKELRDRLTAIPDGEWITDPELFPLITHALNEKDEMVPISEEVRARIESDDVRICKEKDGYRLYKKDTDICIDPEKGSEYRLHEEIQKEELERDDETEEAARAAGIRAETNEELIARQQIVIPPSIKEDFRFYTVDRLCAFAKEPLEIRNGTGRAASAVGLLAENGLCWVLKNVGNGWLYAESGDVRGYVKADALSMGREAVAVLREYMFSAKDQHPAGSLFTAAMDSAPLAQALMTPAENAAFADVRATTKETLAEKKYALSKEENVRVREGKNTDSRIVGVLSKDALCYMLADFDNEWVYIESGDVRGFVKSEFLAHGPGTDARIREHGEDQFAGAKLKIKPENNRAVYYTCTSVYAPDPGGQVREALITYASQFLGNPYVWGGTDPVNGTDCSGFALRVYQAFGYALPRVSEYQAQVGMKIPVSSALPGDLIFYAESGHVYHVVIYAGDGTTIEAANESVGIIRGRVNYGAAVWATRLLKGDTISASMTGPGTADAEAEDYGASLGRFTVSAVCGCEACTAQVYDGEREAEAVYEGQTAFADPSVIEPGTKVVVRGHIFTVRSSTRKCEKDEILIYFSDHGRAAAWPEKTEEVFSVQ